MMILGTHRRQILVAALFLVGPVLSPAGDLEFMGPNGERLSVWESGESEVSLEFQCDTGTYGGLGRNRNDVYIGVLDQFPEGAEESAVVGNFFLRLLPGEVGDAVLIVSMNEGGTISPESSGTYRRLDYEAQLKLARLSHAEADEALNAAYQEAMNSLPEEKKTDMRERQRGWIKYRDYLSENQAGFDEEAEGDPKKSVTYWESMAGLSEIRTEFLKANLRGNPDQRIDGAWMDEAGGRMQLSLTDEPGKAGGVKFKIVVVRGPTFHIGEIEGIAPFTDDEKTRAVFIDTDPDAVIDGKACRLEFLFDGERIELKGENTQYYHGARAYFDGTYFRIGPLDAE